jgi:heat-inducible transcriptional repressor
MADLSERQIIILKHIIEEYIETAQPVGSVSLDKKFILGVSPATLRNEMAELTKLGFLAQPHTSAGRAPTPMALRYYVNNLMQSKNMSVTDEVKIKEKVYDYKTEFDKALREATRELAQATKSLAIAVDNDGDVYSAGVSHILEMPEFFDIDLTRNVLSLLDHFDYLNKIFSRGLGDGNIHILMSDDLGYEYLAPCAMVFARFGEGKKHGGTIGIVGPCRLNYQRLIPTVTYVGNLLDEMVKVW